MSVSIDEIRDPYLAYCSFEQNHRDILAAGIADAEFRNRFVKQYWLMSREEFDTYFECISFQSRESLIRSWLKGF